MIAWKFLGPRGVAPFSGVRWPLPQPGGAGEWLFGGPGDRGVHACEVAHLPWWLGEELWRVELSGPTSRARHQVVAARGRLVQRIESWPEARAAFMADCIGRLRALAGRDGAAAGYLRDMDRCDGRPAVCATIAANAAAAAGGMRAHDEERALQARWLEQHLGLREP